MAPSIRDTRGVSLVEVMVAMIVVGLIGTALVGVLRSQHDAFSNQNEGIRATQNVRAAVEMLAEELQNAGFDPRGSAGAGFTTTDADDIAWTADLDADGDVDDLGDAEQVRYSFSAEDGALYREVDGTATTVAAELQSFTFTYLDEDLAVTADADAVRYVKMDVTYETPEGVVPGALEAKVPIRNRLLGAAGTIPCSALPTVLVNGNLEISGNPTLSGCNQSLHTNGNLKIGGDMLVHGSVTASGSVDQGASVQDEEGGEVDVQGGAETTDVPDIDNPTVTHCDDADYVLRAEGKIEDTATGDLYDARDDEKFGWKRSGDGPVTWDYSGDDRNPGTYCAEGNVTLSGNPGEGDADPVEMSVIAKGSIEVSGNPYLTADDSGGGYLFLAGGDLKLNGNAMGSKTNWTGTIYGYSQCEVSGAPKLASALICRDGQTPGHAEDWVSENKISGDMQLDVPCATDCDLGDGGSGGNDGNDGNNCNGDDDDDDDDDDGDDDDDCEED